MPRTGGVFSLLSGSKGSPNTTIQSVPYNSQLDDFAQDANLARPITAGGTAATTASGARANLGLVAVASSGSASDLTTGTLADARLPTTQTGKTFTSSTSISGAFLTIDDDLFPQLVLRTKTGGINRGQIYYNIAGTEMHFLTFNAAGVAQRELILPETGNMLWNGAAVWTAGNDGASSGLDADLLDGQQGTFYTALANATGTLADARLPSTMSGKVFNSDVTMFTNVFACTTGGVFEIGAQNGSALPAVIDFHTTATPIDYNARIVAFGGTSAAPGNADIDIICNGLSHNGSNLWDTANLAPISQAEAQAGTGTTNRAWTAQRVAQAAKAAFPVFISAQQTFTAGGTVTVAHGLGSPPSQVVVDFVCTTADIGFSPGNVVKVYPAHVISNNGLTGYVDASNVYILMSSAGISFGTKTTGVGANITPANWRIVVRATP